MWATTESQAGRTLSGTSDSMPSHTYEELELRRRIQPWLRKQNRPRSLNNNESDYAHPVERGRDEVRNVHDVGVELGDGLGDLTEGPRPPGLHVVQQVVDQGRKVRLEKVEERLNKRRRYFLSKLPKVTNARVPYVCARWSYYRILRRKLKYIFSVRD